MVASFLGLVLLLPIARFAAVFGRGLEWADEGQIYLAEVIVESAALREARGAPHCTVFTNNPGALLASASFPRVHKLPRSAAEIAPLLEGDAAVCIAYFTMHDARSIEASRPDHERLLEELERRGLSDSKTDERTREGCV